MVNAIKFREGRTFPCGIRYRNTCKALREGATSGLTEETFWLGDRSRGFRRRDLPESGRSQLWESVRFYDGTRSIMAMRALPDGEWTGQLHHEAMLGIEQSPVHSFFMVALTRISDAMTRTGAVPLGPGRVGGRPTECYRIPWSSSLNTVLELDPSRHYLPIRVALVEAPEAAAASHSSDSFPVQGFPTASKDPREKLRVLRSLVAREVAQTGEGVWYPSVIESDCDEVSGAHEIATVIGLDGREPEPTDKPVPFETLMPGSGSLVDQATKQNVSFGPGRAKREQSVVGAYITTGQNLANVPPGASASGLRWKYVIVAAAIGALSTILVARRWSVGTRHGRAND